MEFSLKQALALTCSLLLSIIGVSLIFASYSIKTLNHNEKSIMTWIGVIFLIPNIGILLLSSFLQFHAMFFPSSYDNIDDNEEEEKPITN